MTPQFTGGILTPVRASSGGGIQLLSGDDYVIQLVKNLCGDFDSDNPFLGRGIGSQAIFANLTDPGWQTVQINRVKDVFTKLERGQIAKLKSVDIIPSKDRSGVATMRIEFLSIESATDLMVETTARRGT